jgi:hypothetical protein
MRQMMMVTMMTMMTMTIMMDEKMSSSYQQDLIWLR